MKNMMICAALCAVFSLPVAAGDKVRLSYEGSEKRIDVGDLKQTSVCTLKKQVAGMFGLKNKEFYLKKSGMKLRDDKTLYGANVRSNNAVQVVRTKGSSQQC